MRNVHLFLPFFLFFVSTSLNTGNMEPPVCPPLSSKISGPCSAFFISGHSNTFSRKSVRRLLSHLTPIFPYQSHIQNISKFQLPYLQIISRTCLLLTTFLLFYASPSSCHFLPGLLAEPPNLEVPKLSLFTESLVSHLQAQRNNPQSHLLSR